MPFVDVPNVPPQVPPASVAQLAPVAQAKIRFDRVFGICHLAQNPPEPPDTAVNHLSATFAVKEYLRKFEKRNVDGPASTRVLVQPKHGSLKGDEREGGYLYVPANEQYLGKDRAVIVVEVSGLKVKVEYFFRVLDSLPTDSDFEKYCPRTMWRISGSADAYRISSFSYVPSV